MPHLRTDLIWRAALPLAALVALLAGAPQAVTGGLALAGLVLAAERLVALRAGSLGDRVLVGVGGILVVLVLTGLALDAAGVRLRPTSWAAAVVALSALGLVVAALLAPRSPQPDERSDEQSGEQPEAHGRTALKALPWVAVAGLVTVVAVHVSATSLSAADAAPLQLSFGRVSGTSVQVVVSSTQATGPLELRTSSGGDELSYPLITLPADGSQTTTLALPQSGRFVVTLSYPDQTQPLRTLVLDR